MVPLFAPIRQNEPLMGEIQAKIAEVLKSGEYVLGKEVAAFEESLGQRLGYKFAVGCASGTEALVLALRAIGIQPGDEVITPAFSFVASTNSIVWAGGKPAFADVDLETANVTVETVERAWNPRVRAVIAVDLYGRQAPIAELRKWCDRKSLYLIEDGAQSIGVPNLKAHLYTTSFYPTKNMGAVGDAGAVLSDDGELATRVREMTRHGGMLRDHYIRVGTTGRLDTIQAAILNIKLPHLENWTKLHRTIAGAYTSKLKPLEDAGKVWLPKAPADPLSHVWALYTVRVPGDRQKFLDALKAKGVGAAVYYPKIIPRQPVFSATGDFPGADRLAREVVSLPFFAELKSQELEFVVKAVGECLPRPSM